LKSVKLIVWKGVGWVNVKEVVLISEDMAFLLFFKRKYWGEFPEI
jgi:hypothetical protein